MDSASPSRSGKSAADSPAAERPATDRAAADGLVLLDKPEGITSFRCLGRIKRVLGTRRVGHIGTLDPFASGLLGVVTGRCTRLAGLLNGLDKSYRATIRFGLETDTLDPEGAVVADAPVPELDAIRQALPALTGRLRQHPPAFSAVHVAGRRAYSLARSGQTPVLPAREVAVAAAEPIEWHPPDLTVELVCSSGTYVRAWARDLGMAVQSRAYVAHLRRMSIGPFCVRQAVAPSDFGGDHVQPPAAFLGRLPAVQTLRLRPQYRRSLVHGQPPDRHFFSSDPIPGADYYAVLDEDDCLLAVLRWRPSRCSSRSRGAPHAPDLGAEGRQPARTGWSYAGVFVDR